MQKTPPYGVGLAYRACLHREIMQFGDEIDLLEIPTEDYIIRSRRLLVDPFGSLLREALDWFPCVAHGIKMSIGSVEPLDDAYFNATAEFLERTGMSTFSEHLTFHRMDGLDIDMFLAMPFEEVAVDWLAEKYNAARARLGRPLALENVSYHFPIPDCSLDEAQFLTRLTQRTDCTLLIDVTNVFNNARNHGYDPVEFIRSLPGDRVSQLHLAGGHFAEGIWHDSHSAPVMEEVWPLLDEALQHTAANIVILERDSNFIPFGAVIEDVTRAREIFARHRNRQPDRETIAATAIAGSPAANEPNESDERFTDLRMFQRALIRRIGDERFRERFDESSDDLTEDLPPDPRWRDRLRNCPHDRLKFLFDKWKRNEQRKRDEAREFRNWEWRQWLKSGGRRAEGGERRGEKREEGGETR